MIKNTLFFIVMLVLGHSALANKITEKNWKTAPEVVEVRKIYEANQKAKKSWKMQSKKWGYCQPGEDMSRMLIADDKKVPRIYSHSGGSEDSSLTFENYYDENGKLRFVFITGGAVNGSKLEHRIYFRANGDRFWELQKYVKGPGYTFPNPWPKEEMAFDPSAAFSAKNECD